MKWLTIDLIKKHCRIDHDCEDDILEMYAEAAEDAILNTTRRTFLGMLFKYGGIPRPIVNASLLMVAHSYQHRSPANINNLYTVPYAFDFMVKPYMRLEGSEPDTPVDTLDGALISSDGRLLVDKDFRIITCKTS
jgi:uncharacterized phage protein (predicted DNA packaging)